ncbi:MAG: HDIG domain-containing metalloprotein [Planctomycetota bacterium]
MAQGKTVSARRREIRRNLPKQQTAVAATIRRHDVLWAALYATVFAVVGGGLALFARHQPQVTLGDTLDAPVVARVAFTAVDYEATAEDRRRAALLQRPVYTANEEYLQELNARLHSLVQLASTAGSPDDLAANLPPNATLTPRGLEVLRSHYADGNRSTQWEQMSLEALRDFFSIAIIRPERAAELGLNPIQFVRPVIPGSLSPNPALPVEATEVPYSRNAVDRIGNTPEFERAVDTFHVSIRPVIRAVLLQDLQPTYFFDAAETQRRRDRAMAAVPSVQLSFNAGDVVAPMGQPVGSHELALIERERVVFDASRSFATRLAEALGLTGLIALIAIGQWVYILAFNRRVAENPMRGLAFVTLTSAMLATAVLTAAAMPGLALLWATLPTIVVAMVLAIVYEQRFALAVAASQAVVVAIGLEQSAGQCLVALIGVGVVVAMLDDVRTTSTLVRTGFFAAFGMGVTAALAELATPALALGPGWWMRVLVVAGSAAAGGVIAGFVMQGVVPFIERLFHITTAMTLRELNDASNPLLQRMAQEAPGTYAHSLRIADMAESAADSIGANGLLCRVGAMYHDIGKLNKPSYFIENQAGGPNRHAKLSPAMSLLIIVGHVKDGIEMAREYGLPPAIRHFIESHHGTTLVEYFYHAAKKQTEAEDKAAPSEFEFRYPGPKPATREAAIMLLCDSLEAAARTLPEPTPIRIEQLVHTLATKRLMDGQFDDANLTLAELSRVEASITKTLNAIYHARIKYPDGESKPKPAETERTAATA